MAKTKRMAEHRMTLTWRSCVRAPDERATVEIQARSVMTDQMKTKRDRLEWRAKKDNLLVAKRNVKWRTGNRTPDGERMGGDRSSQSVSLVGPKKAS